jgi:hypothetical protein
MDKEGSRNKQRGMKGYTIGIIQKYGSFSKILQFFLLLFGNANICLVEIILI